MNIIMERFINYLDEFVGVLKVKFPDKQKTIKKSYKPIKMAISIKSTIISDKFQKHLSIYKEHINNDEYDKLLEQDFQSIIEDNLIKINQNDIDEFKKFWVDNVDNDTKKEIFKYLKVLIWCLENIDK